MTRPNSCSWMVALAVLVASETPAFAQGGFDPADGRAGRVALEGVGFLGGALVGAGAGALVGTPILCSAWRCRDFGVLAAMAISGAAGAFIGSSAGVYAAGRYFRDSNGSYWGALGGGTVGAAAGIGMIATGGYLMELGRDADDPLALALISLGVGVIIAGPIVGYELTSHREGSSSTASATSTLTAPPTLLSLSF